MRKRFRNKQEKKLEEEPKGDDYRDPAGYLSLKGTLNGPAFPL